MKNPFILSPKVDKELFCDREKDLQDLLQIVTNGANATLISPRRLGKTGLIYRLFDEIKEQKKGIETFYVDIYATQNTEDFVTAFAEAILDAYKKKRPLFKKVLNAIGGMKPTISFDKLTGSPELSLTFNSDNEKLNTLNKIFDFLENLEKPVIVAFDEFQQIREYKGIYMEAVLRTRIQMLKNVNFIFCGSRRHIMADMFINARSPFYCSTMPVNLGKIDADKYYDFVSRLFSTHGKTIEPEAIRFILDFTRCHTFYTQSLCNFVFQQTKKQITLAETKNLASQLLSLNETIYLQYRSLLTPQQWNYLKAIAKENSISQPMSNAFLSKYSIGTPANSQRLLSSLIEKDLILQEISINKSEYFVYDVFLSRWLECN